MIKIISCFADILVPEIEYVIEKVMMNIFLTENTFLIISTFLFENDFFNNGIIDIFQIC